MPKGAYDADTGCLWKIIRRQVRYSQAALGLVRHMREKDYRCKQSHRVLLGLMLIAA